jgi:class I fructose-bisphosphate aldolase
LNAPAGFFYCDAAESQTMAAGREASMNVGKLIHLNRLFSHPSGRLCSIAVDHFIGYGAGLPDGLREIKSTLAAIVAAEPDAITMHRGIATSAWSPFAGRVPLIMQSMIARPDDTAYQQLVTAEESVRLGADAIAVVAYVRGKTEAMYLRGVSDCVREAARFEMPVICHIYPRVLSDLSQISFAPEDIAWATRCAVEAGVDVVKTPFCGDVQAHAQIVADSPVPVVAAGGPKQETFEAALNMMAQVVQSGARGATIGRNVWGFGQITQAVRAFKAVIHQGKTAQEALQIAGL